MIFEMSSFLQLTIACSLFFFITIINQPSQARTLANPTPNNPSHHHHKISFLMQDVLNLNQSSLSSKPSTTKLTSQLPFSKPLGFFPPNKGTLLLPQPYPEFQDTTHSPSYNMGLSFASMAAPRELEFVILTIIDELLFQDYGSIILGKAQGMYVASSEDGSSHMMALTASLAGEDSLRFFGVHRSDVPESHIAVIGGTGEFHSANGYATVKTVNVGQKDGFEGGNNRPKRLLMFNVHLSYHS